MLTPSEHLNSPTSLRGGRVAQSLVFCVVKHWPLCLFVFILLAILIICSYMYIYRVPTEFWKWGYNGVQLLFFLNFVPLHIESPYNFGGTGPILGVKNPLQRVNGHAATNIQIFLIHFSLLITIHFTCMKIIYDLTPLDLDYGDKFTLKGFFFSVNCLSE
jgi:hypothetical protein